MKNSKITAFFEENKYIVLAFLLGIVLMAMPLGNSKEEKQASDNISDESFSLEKEEKRLEELIEEIEGAGKAKVVLSLHSGAEQILAEDEFSEEGKREKETVVVSRSYGGEEALTVKYIYPKYLGAAVAMEGADSSKVRLSVIDAVSSVTGLSPDKISVIKMKSK